MNEIKRQGTSSLIRVNDLITAFVKSQYSKVDQYKILKEINNILELEGLKSSFTQYSEILTFESIHLLMKRNHIVRGKVSIIHHMIW